MKNRLIEIISRTFDIETVNIKDDFSMQNCEKWDSLGQLILVTNIEAEFNITIEPDMIAKLRTLQAIDDFLQNAGNHE